MTAFPSDKPMDITRHAAFLARYAPDLTLQDFREFYAGIPDENWLMTHYGYASSGACCAEGHLGVDRRLGIQGVMDDMAHVKRLDQLLRVLDTPDGFPHIPNINDGIHTGWPKACSTMPVGPKARMLMVIDKAIELGVQSPDDQPSPAVAAPHGP